MKIKPELETKCTFQSLEVGTVFKFGKCVMMKVQELATDHCIYNNLNLTDNQIGYANPTIVVTPVPNAVLILK